MPLTFPPAVWLSPASAFLASVGDPLECAAPGATPFLSPIQFPLAGFLKRTVCTAHQAAPDSAGSPAKHRSKYWAVFIKGRHELSLNFDCSHYQNAATEILLAGSEAQAERWGCQTIRLLVSKCNQFPLRRVCLGMRWHSRHRTLDYRLWGRLFAPDNGVA